jgi:flagellar biogenesis protein FliO
VAGTAGREILMFLILCIVLAVAWVVMGFLEQEDHVALA